MKPMKQLILITSSLAFAALLGSATAFAADASGTAVTKVPARTKVINVTDKTRYVNAIHGQVLRFKLSDGTDFAWKFDGTTNYVNLPDIAPKGSMAPNIRVYVGSKPGESND
ncbi:MAG: Heavy-metal resistance protein CzcE [Proteobacteria bacterium]|nr:Heavy-metal resistance protein CzcE [Pseudomonadota bacterium]